MFQKEYLEVFLKNQSQLFDEAVAETMEEAEEFLNDCMAQIVNSVEEVRDYLEESGMDVTGMGKEELLKTAEVFSLPDGKFLIVEA